MTCQTILGQAARGDNFFPRPKITDGIWEKLSQGSNILLVAPRRVGKSSILFHLLDNPMENHLVIYYTSESVNNENEFFRKLFKHITDELSGAEKILKKGITTTKDLLSRIEQIGKEGISIGKSKTVYSDEIKNMIRSLKFDKGKIIVLLDEFSQTVENIAQDEGERNAVHFLETKREIRQAPEIHQKLQFIYSGSIGLENIVGRMNGMNLINDLTPILLQPLSTIEAEALTEKILNNTGFKFDAGAFDHLLSIIEWRIPYYFQLILDETCKILVDEKSDVITKQTIDLAVNNALQQRIYFEHWFTRLRKAYKSDEFSFVKELLNLVSEERAVPSQKVFDLAVKYKIENSYNDLVNALKHDGYINNQDDPKTYHFNSPLLREWWNRNVAN